MNLVFNNGEILSNVSQGKDYDFIDGKFVIYSDSEPNESGFAFMMDDIIVQRYYDFTTLYKKEEDKYILSDDGSVYVEPTPIVTFVAGNGGALEGETVFEVEKYSEITVPTPIANENYIFVGWDNQIPKRGSVTESATYTATFEYVEPIESIRENKISELNVIQQEVIANGTDVMLSDGTVQHFTATEHDQTSLLGLTAMIAQGMQQIPWHCADKNVGCQFYSVEDANIIINGVSGWVTFHVTYYRDLRRMILNMDDADAIRNLEYGVVIPEEYQSEVLKELYASMNTEEKGE